MYRPQFESLDQVAEATADTMVRAATGSAFQLFRDREFRRLAAIEQLSQTEQDRIFNELVVASVVLIMLLLEAPDLRMADEFRVYCAELRARIPRAHVNQLGSMGVEGEHLRDWERLITMRYEEYARDRHDVRAAAMGLESSEKGLTVDGLSNIQLLVPVQTAAIGCHDHVCRGNTDGRGELFKTILRSLSRLYLELRVPLEGGRITPLTRARVAVKRTLRRMRRKT